MKAGAGALLLLAACSGGKSPAAENGLAPALDLENAAIERGLIPDPSNREIAGLYTHETDRLCIVPDGLGYRAGAFADFGDGVTCSGTGQVSRVGDTLHFEFGEAQAGCSFDATLDGTRVAFPGQVPDGCAKLCSGRASLAGFEVTRVSEALSEAQAARDPGGRRLCSD